MGQNVLLLKKQSTRLVWICAHKLQKQVPRASGCHTFLSRRQQRSRMLTFQPLYPALTCQAKPKPTFCNSSAARTEKGWNAWSWVQRSESSYPMSKVTERSASTSPFQLKFSSVSFTHVHSALWKTVRGFCGHWMHWDWTQGPKLARALYHWAIAQAWHTASILCSDAKSKGPSRKNSKNTLHLSQLYSSNIKGTRRKSSGETHSDPRLSSAHRVLRFVLGCNRRALLGWELCQDKCIHLRNVVSNSVMP